MSTAEQPPSVRFLGRKVYAGAMVFLATALQQAVGEAGDSVVAAPGDHATDAGPMAEVVDDDVYNQPVLDEPARFASGDGR